jgi:putative ABC transport system permease protein
METEIITISYTKLSISITLVLIPGLISAFLKLGLLKSILWGGTRTIVQLTLIGYVLNFIFAQNR